MGLKIRLKRSAASPRGGSLIFLIAFSALALVAMIGFSIFGYYYFKYQSIVDERLKQPLFANTAKVFAAPREVRPGQKLTVRLIANELREAGYSTDGATKASPLGSYSEDAASIAIHPGPQSYHAEDGATIRVQSGVVESITDDHTANADGIEEPHDIGHGQHCHRVGSLRRKLNV